MKKVELLIILQLFLVYQSDARAEMAGLPKFSCNSKTFGEAACKKYEQAMVASRSEELAKARDILGGNRDLDRIPAAQALLGHVSEHLKDWPNAEIGYRRFLQLTEADATIDWRIRWATRDALVMALGVQGKVKDSLAEANKNVTLVMQKGDRELLAISYYNLACAYAAGSDTPHAIEALKDAIAIDPSNRTKATTDDSFAALIKTREFQELISSRAVVDEKNNTSQGRNRELIVLAGCTGPEASRDLQHSADGVKDWMAKNGIVVRVDASSSKCGYKMVNGTKSRVVAGVVTDVDLVDIAKGFFLSKR